jgi:Protein of unknown function (DUF3662)/Inner membrane component of T3SS, cytoplasmic domain
MSVATMGFLRTIESRIEGAFEGTFGRAFRANVEPVELARKLAKELEDGKVVSLNQVYAPNDYVVYLNPRDRERFAEYEASLRTELGVYLADHARRQGYTLTTRPRVRFETEPSLALGTFGIARQLTEEEAPPEEPEGEAVAEDIPPPTPEELDAMAPGPPAAFPEEPLPVPVPVPLPEPEPATEVAPAQTTAFTPDEVAAAAARAVLTVDGHSVPLTGDVVAIGRSSGCDVVLDDPNVSRRHAELRLGGATPVVVDLGSTNGTSVNGRRVREQALAFGDRIVLGSTTLVLERPEG